MTSSSWVSSWAAIGLVGDHLWQSTLFAAIAALLTLALRTNRAHVRYWLWLAASVKFLVPFAALVALGSQFGWPSSASIVQPELTLVIDAMSQPFSRPELRVAAAAPGTASDGVAAGVPILLFAIWFCGFGVILLSWCARWRRVAAAVRQASPIESGRELDALRRLEQVHSVGAGRETRPRSLALVFSEAALEPGVFGIVKPVLLWPRSMSDHLNDAQVEAILAHEVSHVRRRDNFAAAVHMVVQAVFWFHPLVWWLGARLVEERERACDEDVIRLGSEPLVYAESILKTCQVYLESPLVCVAGVTGSDLKERMERIMKNDAGTTLNIWRKLLLATVGIVAITGPVSIGVLNAPLARAQSQAAGAGAPAFEVASVKRNKSGEGFVSLGMQPGGRFMATNVPLRMLIRNAYQLQDSQLVGGPSWITSDRFDIVAKAEGDLPPQPPGGPPGPMMLMLRTLLADRFKLVVHTETRELPIYALVLARSDGRLGPQLRPAAVDCAAVMAAARARGGPAPAPPAPGERPTCGIRIGPGQMAGGGFPLSPLANSLSQFVQRVVVNRTGLTGNFDFDLTWTPDQLSEGSLPPGAAAPPPIDPNGPSLFTAVQEQLGLRLESQRGPVEVLVIDSAEQPTEN